MKSNLLSLLIVTAFICGSNRVAASETQSYGAIQIAQGEYSDNDLDDVEPGAVVVRLGVQASEHFGFELRYGRGIEDDSIDILGVDVDVDIESVGGFYALYHLSTDFRNSFYGIVGISEVEAKVSSLGQSDQEDENGFSIGGGFNFSGISIEYMRYLDLSDFEFSTISIGYMYSF